MKSSGLEIYELSVMKRVLLSFLLCDSVLPPKVTRAQINAVELILGQDTREFRLSWCDHWRSETRSKIYYQINV